MSQKAPSHRVIRDALRKRAKTRMSTVSDDALLSWLSEAIYLERKRFSEQSVNPGKETEAIQRLARTLNEERKSQISAGMALVRDYADEIHNRFSERTYGIATRLLPGAITRLLTASDPTTLLGADFDPASRICVDGPLDLLGELAKTHTLVLAPTHISNLDSPFLGYALYQAGLPPCIYGAGLNLFSNPSMAFFMSRLGAYTVDRNKQHRLYKDTLKDYSTELLGRGAHSLFFPGGTRSRNGSIETHLKLGLLGTAITAWQEGLEQGRPQPEIVVVPATITFPLVLEAETLIEDSLKAEGKSRYIITDDEFSEPTTVLSYARKVLNKDGSVYIRFGAPLDLIGNPVDADGMSLDPVGERFDRRAYVCGRDGLVIRDEQRDRVYTEHLAAALTQAYTRGTTVVATHLAAYAAWEELKIRYPQLDTFHRVLLSPEEQWIDRAALVARLDTLMKRLTDMESKGDLKAALSSENAEEILENAITQFEAHHTRRCLSAEDWRILVDPKLALYYGNRVKSVFKEDRK